MTYIIALLSVFNCIVIWTAGPYLFDSFAPKVNGVKDPWVGQLATEYSKFISVGVMFYHFACCYQFMANGMGQTQITLIMTSFASLVHLVLASALIDVFPSKMTGIGISSMIHMFCRFLIAVVFVRFNKVTSEALIPFSDPESRKDLKEMAILGFNSFLLRVMAWWAFDVFTQLAATLET